MLPCSYDRDMTESPSAPPIVSTAWLDDHLDDEDLRIVDATITLRPPADACAGWTAVDGSAAHQDEHLPRAQYADLLRDFSAPVGRFARPPLEQLTESLQRLGIGADSRVVIYDRAGAMWAARLWWVLRSYGFENASVLDGGFARWVAEGRPTTSEPFAPVAGSGSPFIPRDRPELFVDKADVLDVVQNGGAVLVNALDTADFVATTSSSYARPGRIPGSVSQPASRLTRDDGSFLPVEQLRTELDDVLSQPGPKVTYCGGGIAASLAALVLTQLGEDDVAVYDASYEEWASDASLPVEVEPG